MKFYTSFKKYNSYFHRTDIVPLNTSPHLGINSKIILVTFFSLGTILYSLWARVVTWCRFYPLWAVLSTQVQKVWLTNIQKGPYSVVSDSKAPWILRMVRRWDAVACLTAIVTISVINSTIRIFKSCGISTVNQSIPASFSCLEFFLLLTQVATSLDLENKNKLTCT